MKLGWVFGIACAIFLHVFVLYFGRLFFPRHDDDKGSLQKVDLLRDVESEKPKDEKKPEDLETKPAEELKTEEEAPPDASEIVRSLDASLVNDAPALEAASLGDIEAALNGGGGGGDFAQAFGFASGGRIGGTGVAGMALQKMDEAFSLAELDQKPRAIIQTSPVYPTEMQGKKTEGVVTVLFVVDAGGKVENPRVEKSSHKAFELPALNAIKRWKFEPGLRAGQRVPSKMRISIRFPANQP